MSNGFAIEVVKRAHIFSNFNEISPNPGTFQIDENPICKISQSIYEIKGIRNNERKTPSVKRNDF